MESLPLYFPLASISLFPFFILLCHLFGGPYPTLCLGFILSSVLCAQGSPLALGLECTSSRARELQVMPRIKPRSADPITLASPFSSFIFRPKRDEFKAIRAGESNWCLVPAAHSSPWDRPQSTPQPHQHIPHCPSPNPKLLSHPLMGGMSKRLRHMNRREQTDHLPRLQNSSCHPNMVPGGVGGPPSSRGADKGSHCGWGRHAH